VADLVVVLDDPSIRGMNQALFAHARGAAAVAPPDVDAH
jgi:hypothetical protein